MLMTNKGVRFELSPWRARRVMAQVKEIARRRGKGQAGMPAGVLQDLKRILRFARPAGKLVHRQTGERMRVFDAVLPDGVFRMMTQSSPGREAIVGVAFRASSGEMEQEAQYGGNFSIRWLVGGPVLLKDAIANVPASPGVYLVFRKTWQRWTLKYVGKGENLRERLGTRFEYARQHGEAGQLGVMYGIVLGPMGGVLNGDKVQQGISAAEHALIRTLDPRHRTLTNLSSTSQFGAKPQGLVVDSVLPAFLSGANMALNPAYDMSSNRVVVNAGGVYELGSR